MNKYIKPEIYPCQVFFRDPEKKSVTIPEPVKSLPSDLAIFIRSLTDQRLISDYLARFPRPFKPVFYLISIFYYKKNTFQAIKLKAKFLKLP